jgi:hypothetical protein
LFGAEHAAESVAGGRDVHVGVGVDTADDNCDVGCKVVMPVLSAR